MITPRAHVLRFLLAPDEFWRLSERFEHRTQLFLRERIKLLHPDDRRIRDLLRRAIIQQVIINLARAKNDALDFFGGPTSARRESLRSRPVVKFFRRETKPARSAAELFGVMMMSGLTKSRFI